MPGTASERGLLDPFNPVKALPKIGGIPRRVAQPVRQSRACGRRLQCRAAPGAGMARRHRRGCRQETRNYVRAITGSPVEDWAKAGKGGKTPESAPPTTCRDLMALLKRAPNSFVIRLEERVKLAAAKLWGVQLAAGFDRNGRWRCTDARCGVWRRDRRSRSEHFELDAQRSRGAHVFYQVRIGADTRPEADRALQQHPPLRRRLLCAAESCCERVAIVIAEERKRRSNPSRFAVLGSLGGACHRAALRADPLARSDG